MSAPTITLHVLPPSHPCRTAERALQLKGLEFEKVELVPGAHVEEMTKIYGAHTVPGMLLDGEPVHGSRAILALRLAAVAPVPAGIAEEVREAERWGDEVLQDLGRRMPWGALHFRPEAAGLIAGGGTAMSTWLDLARELFAQTPAAIRHAVLLTDGRNESDRTGALEAALDRCRGQFACDARGIGDDWEPRDLQRIASVLRGSADAVLEDAELAGDFRRLVERAMGRTVPDVRLRLTTMPYSRLRFVKQVFPTEVELTAQCHPQEGNAIELPTGAWGDELREYHVCLDVETGELTRYEDRLLGTVTLFAGADRAVGEQQAVVGYLTDDLALSSVPDDNVARVTGQAELGRAVRAGWEAFERDDRVAAAREWGTAVRLATELGNAEILKRLGRLIDVRDDGTVAIKDGVRPRDGFSLVLGSTISTYTGAAEPVAVAPEAVGAPRECVHCGHKARPTAKRCGHCGEPFEAGAPS